MRRPNAFPTRVITGTVLAPLVFLLLSLTSGAQSGWQAELAKARATEHLIRHPR